ncbi:MAG: hypothetical protein Kow0099_30210 [Candidatus Abyssubacteria bacterium]
MMSNLVGVNPAKVYVGLPVEVIFEQVAGDISLPKFKLAV